MSKRLFYFQNVLKAAAHTAARGGGRSRQIRAAAAHICSWPHSDRGGAAVDGRLLPLSGGSAARLWQIDASQLNIVLLENDFALDCKRSLVTSFRGCLFRKRIAVKWQIYTGSLRVTPSKQKHAGIFWFVFAKVWFVTPQCVWGGCLWDRRSCTLRHVKQLANGGCSYIFYFEYT